MRKRKLTIIVFVLLSFRAAADTASARTLHAHQKAPNPQRARACHCHLGHAGHARYLPLAGFENEYGVEKWESALRQSREHWSR